MKIRNQAAILLSIALCACAQTRPAQSTDGSDIFSRDGYQEIANTPEIEAAAEGSARQRLKDPDSAQFKALKVFRRDDDYIAVCGEVNAKNSYGGYAGFTPFVAHISWANLPEGKHAYEGIGAMINEADDNAFYQLAPICDPQYWN